MNIFGSLICVSSINKAVSLGINSKVPAVYSEKQHDLEDNLSQGEKHRKTGALGGADPAPSPNVFRTEANAARCHSRLPEFSPVDTQINLYHRLPGFCGLVCQQQPR